jgi:transcriptional regulator with XRE-family HTH domain
VAAFPDLLQKDRERRGFSIGQVAWRLGVKPQEYRELEAGKRSPDFETWDRICKLYGWPQTFVQEVSQRAKKSCWCG